MREDDGNVEPLSAAHTGVCFILTWERNRREPVTVEELHERLGMSRDQAKAIMADLVMRGLADVRAWQPR